MTDLGIDFYDWAKNEGLAREPWLAAACLGKNADDGSAKLLQPVKGGEFLLLSDLPLADQAIPVRVRASPELAPLSVFVDGAQALQLNAPFTGRVPATQGAHVLEVKDRNGAVLDSVRYLVRR